MIKTDQSADYYEGAIDCLLECAAHPDWDQAARYELEKSLLHRLYTQRNAYYDRFAADCAPKCECGDNGQCFYCAEQGANRGDRLMDAMRDSREVAA